MKILYQWTRIKPKDWFEIDSSLWWDLDKSPEPTGGETIENDPRASWIYRINVQGVEFTADHYAVEHIDETCCRVTIWNDDPDDYPVGERFARVWTFRCLAPDENLGGAINTNQTQEVFADDDVGARIALAKGGTYRPYSEFVLPPEEAIRHGIWMDEGANAAHNAVRTRRGWREWTEGLDPSEVENGELKSQREQGRYLKNTGTKTFIQRTGAGNIGTIHTAVAAFQRLEQTRFITNGSATIFGDNVAGSSDDELNTFITPANEPNDAAWTTGNYRAQLDITSAGADLTYGLLDQGASEGHFARVNSGLTADLETKQQVESAFNGTGLKLATTGSVSWTAGAAGDRFEILISGARPASHGQQSIDYQVNTDDSFADGPWPSELENTVAVTDNLIVELIEGVLQRTVSDTVAVTENLIVEGGSVDGLSAPALGANF